MLQTTWWHILNLRSKGISTAWGTPSARKGAVYQCPLVNSTAISYKSISKNTPPYQQGETKQPNAVMVTLTQSNRRVIWLHDSLDVKSSRQAAHLAFTIILSAKHQAAPTHAGIFPSFRPTMGSGGRKGTWSSKCPFWAPVSEVSAQSCVFNTVPALQTRMLRQDQDPA